MDYTQVIVDWEATEICFRWESPYISLQDIFQDFQHQVCSYNVGKNLQTV